MSTLMTATPEGCTCVWSIVLDDDREVAGSVLFTGQDCPAKPHPRSFSAESLCRSCEGTGRLHELGRLPEPCHCTKEGADRG